MHSLSSVLTRKPKMALQWFCLSLDTEGSFGIGGTSHCRLGGNHYSSAPIRSLTWGRGLPTEAQRKPPPQTEPEHQLEKANKDADRLSKLAASRWQKCSLRTPSNLFRNSLVYRQSQISAREITWLCGSQLALNLAWWLGYMRGSTFLLHISSYAWGLNMCLGALQLAMLAEYLLCARIPLEPHTFLWIDNGYLSGVLFLT